MPKRLSSNDILGTRYGRLIISADLGKGKYTRMVKVACDCGNEKTVTLNGLRMGHTQSCGCYQAECRVERAYKHGLSKHPLFRKWVSIKRRCNNKTYIQFKYYGGRGISICPQWENDAKAFVDWALSNGWEPGLTIDRIDVDGNYEPSNCRFVTNDFQQRNKRSNVRFTINGETKCLKEWCRLLGLNFKLSWQRHKRDGLPLEKILIKP